VELALVGDPADDAFRALARVAARRFVPSLVIAGGPPDENADLPLLAGRARQDGRPTAYLCRAYACDAPVSDPAALDAQLRRVRGG